MSATTETVESVSQALSGGYSSSATGATIYSKGLYYYTYFSVVGSPGTSKVTTMNWKYSLSYKPTGFVAYLCHEVAGCINVTTLGSGTTSAFSGAAANKRFYLAYGVSGTGTMSPAYGNLDQVNVTYQ